MTEEQFVSQAQCDERRAKRVTEASCVERHERNRELAVESTGWSKRLLWTTIGGSIAVILFLGSAWVTTWNIKSRLDSHLDVHQYRDETTKETLSDIKRGIEQLQATTQANSKLLASMAGPASHSVPPK